MAINIGGLATGMDTNALIEQLMKAERRPLERLERDKSYENSRIAAFKDFDQKLKDLLSKVEAIDTSKEIRSFKATSPTSEFFSLSSSSSAVSGTYQVEVKALSRLQKNVSQGYASMTDANFGTGKITINGQDINYSGDSLSTLRDKINAVNTGATPTGVSASIINDGSTGYRLVLTGKDGATSFTASVTETVAGTYAPPAFTTTQTARQGHIFVDGVNVYSKSDVFSEAIPGVTLTANKENTAGVSTTVTVGVDKEGIKSKVSAFVEGYNEIFRFVSKQADADWGKDSSFRSVKGRIQGLLVSEVASSGSLKRLSELGLETNKKDGTISLNSSVFDNLVTNNLDSVDKLLAGETGVDGVTKKFKDYLKGVTDLETGIYAGRKEVSDTSIRRIDQQVQRQEARLEQREKTLRAQFDAMETLVSSMSGQSSYLAQQIGLWSQR